jgi:DNA ligase (NAD+)
VDLSGTTVSRATLHNWDEVKRKGVYDGATVRIAKAGEIIPQVLEVLSELPEGAAPAGPPTTCPSCGGPILRAEGEVALRCPNRFGCPAQLQARVEHFVGKGGLDVDGMGTSLVAQLIAAGLVRDLGDVFLLEHAAIAGLERMGDKSAENVVRGIASVKANLSLARLVTALGIPLVGEVAAQAIAGAFEDFRGFVHATEADLGRLDDLDGVGPKIAGAVRAFLADPNERAVLEKVLAAGVDPKNAARPEGPLSGVRICITGTLSKSREAYKKLIEAAGGHFSTAVTKETQFLVAGDKTGDAKLKSAQKHGARVIDEAGLERLLEKGAP